ncbi:unnamed protein product [Nippostrongylus brasiliensis]|uniref:G_PROTEIN_RECEP_F1_2 domain-containing protein n=1 Tax=Nippostrongylus brasiliensis TaxID=27835 RepID=A0A158R169_NIPBR|nr:unnamed protein product [Nippostrongylus brasiliensis]
MISTSRLIVGLFLNVEAWAILLLNIFVLWCIIKSRLYANKDHSVYVLSGFNIASEICQLTLHVLYIGPSVVAGTWFFHGQDSLGVTIISTVFLGLWYLGSLLQILFATNRFVVICFPTRTFFTRRSVVCLIGISVLCALAMVLYSQIFSPCCRITPDPRVFGYSYLVFPNQTTNPSMYYVDLPLDAGTSIYCGISYIALFGYVFKAGTKNSSAGRREIRCCIQFLLMFLTYSVAWLTFFVYPAFGIEAAEAYVVTPSLVVLNGGVNSIIYLILNKEVRHAANQVLGREVFKESRSSLDPAHASSKNPQCSSTSRPIYQSKQHA